jgi:hypothetical protein
VTTVPTARRAQNSAAPSAPTGSRSGCAFPQTQGQSGGGCLDALIVVMCAVPTTLTTVVPPTPPTSAAPLSSLPDSESALEALANCCLAWASADAIVRVT